MADSAEKPAGHEIISNNEATKASDQFIVEKQNKFTRAIGTVLRTASTEFLTLLGAPFIPLGLTMAGLSMAGGGWVRTPTMEGYVPVGHPAITAAGLGSATVAGLTAALGTRIGWEGAKHDEGTKKLFKAGKIAEFAGMAAQVFTTLPIYPITKAFSVAATFFSQLKRPGSF